MAKAECLSFEEITPGMKRGFEVTVTHEMLTAFSALTGDNNPLHMDCEYAKNAIFGKPVAHGMLVSSFLSRLVGMHLPGERSLFLSQTLNFRNPVHENDRVTVTGEVIRKSDRLKLITLKTTIARPGGEIVIDGEAKVIYRE